MHAFSDVKGCYVIINNLESTYDSDGSSPAVILTNSWWRKKDFRENFRFLYDEIPNQFTPVERIAPPKMKVNARRATRVRYDQPLRSVRRGLR